MSDNSVTVMLRYPITDPPYDIFAREAFARNGLRPYTSPADQVIADFVSRGISVDQLYCMLGEMDAWGCMAILEDYGKHSPPPPTTVPGHGYSGGLW